MVIRALAALAVAVAASPSAVTVSPTVRPGGVLRWHAAGATACTMAERSWSPLQGACYFPIDLLATGSVRVTVTVEGRDRTATVRVGKYPYAEQRLEVEDRMVHLSAEDQARVARENAAVAALWPLEGEARFTLPLAPPLGKAFDGSRFGARRVFNGEPRSPHAGADLRAATGDPVQAAADGRVAIAAAHFFGGNSVYLVHGGGLVTVYMHLSRIDVAEGDEVRRGQIIGAAGATGRVTGPHLHFATRWHGARVDPVLLVGRPEAIPSLVSE